MKRLTNNKQQNKYLFRQNWDSTSESRNATKYLDEKSTYIVGHTQLNNNDSTPKMISEKFNYIALFAKNDKLMTVLFDTRFEISLCKRSVLDKDTVIWPIQDIKIVDIASHIANLAIIGICGTLIFINGKIIHHPLYIIDDVSTTLQSDAIL